MRVGYVRCSTIEQNEARQLKMMNEQNAEKIFTDKASGKNTDRRAFKEMMAFVRVGDIVIVESISRIARNTRDLLSIISERQREGIEIAKAEGKYKGRKPVEVDTELFKTVCKRWRAGEITATAAMNEVGLKPNTFYRRVKEMSL